MVKNQFPLDLASKKKLHEEWSELVTGSKDGLEFDPNDPAFSNLDLEMPPITHTFGKKGYEISIRSGIYYAVFSYMDKKEQIQKEIEIPLFSTKSKSLKFPYKFQVKGKNKEFTEAEFKEIEAMLHSPKRRKSSS
jgi:hypothetical protein